MVALEMPPDWPQEQAVLLEGKGKVKGKGEQKGHRKEVPGASCAKGPRERCRCRRWAHGDEGITSPRATPHRIGLGPHTPSPHCHSQQPRLSNPRRVCWQQLGRQDRAHAAASISAQFRLRTDSRNCETTPATWRSSTSALTRGPRSSTPARSPRTSASARSSRKRVPRPERPGDLRGPEAQDEAHRQAYHEPVHQPEPQDAAHRPEDHDTACRH